MESIGRVYEHQFTRFRFHLKSTMKELGADFKVISFKCSEFHSEE
jgi:hypothetical protein